MTVRDDQGYTLIETLVAFAILAGSLGLALTAAATSFRALRNSQAHEQQLNRASELLQSIAVRSELAATTENSSDSSFAWRVVIAPIPNASASLLQKPFRVSIAVTAQRALTPYTIELNTIMVRKASTP